MKQKLTKMNDRVQHRLQLLMEKSGHVEKSISPEPEVPKLEPKTDNKKRGKVAKKPLHNVLDKADEPPAKKPTPALDFEIRPETYTEYLARNPGEDYDDDDDNDSEYELGSIDEEDDIEEEEQKKPLKTPSNLIMSNSNMLPSAPIKPNALKEVADDEEDELEIQDDDDDDENEETIDDLKDNIRLQLDVICKRLKVKDYKGAEKYAQDLMESFSSPKRSKGVTKKKTKKLEGVNKKSKERKGPKIPRSTGGYGLFNKWFYTNVHINKREGMIDLPAANMTKFASEVYKPYQQIIAKKVEDMKRQNKEPSLKEVNFTSFVDLKKYGMIAYDVKDDDPPNRKAVAVAYEVVDATKDDKKVGAEGKKEDENGDDASKKEDAVTEDVDAPKNKDAVKDDDDASKKEDAGKEDDAEV